MSTSLDGVRNYYDQNTRLFMAFSTSRNPHNIHRAVWTDGARTLDDSLNVTNERIRLEIESVAPVNARIADLGCGVGAGLLYIIPRLMEPALGLGVTLSPVQAHLAHQYSKEAGYERHIVITECDFTRVPLEDKTLHAIFSVEAVAHASKPEDYFQEASRLLRPGGKLILVDDYQAAHAFSPEEAHWLKAFIKGWHVPGVITSDQATQYAHSHHLRLVRNDDLTGHLRLHNIHDGLARALRFIGEHLPIRHAILPSMLGSMALQQCLHQKIIEYRFLVFEKL